MQRKHWISAFATTAGLAIGLLATTAFAQTTVRIAWYSDGNEGEVVSDLLKRFEAQNQDIKVVLDQVPYKAITENLPVQLASGQGPDIARVVDLGGVARYALDMRPYLKDASYWEKNFGPFLPWMRPEGDSSAITGFMTQLTVTGPFVNKTLFEQAGIAMPGAKATWEEWGKAVKAVAEKVQVPFPLAMDRSGHRFFSVAVSEGAKVFDAKGEPAVIDDGFKRAAKLVYDWHNDGVMKKELWGSVSGFTSFVAHVGGPPFQVYALPIRLDPKVLSGTSAILFAATNALKLVPYFALGQFDTTNLTASAVLMPLAPLSTIAGAWLVRRMRPETFYPFTYATVALVAVKLLWDGIAGLL